jgi:hypothetical protein
VRRKRDINRQDRAKVTLDEILERMPLPLAVPPHVEPSGEPSPFYQVYVREIASMNVLLSTITQSLAEVRVLF